jgi:predicted transcriptional regulator
LTADKPLTEHERKLLAVLRANGGWMARQAIAYALHRGHLSSHSSEALNNMAAAGLVEVRFTPNEKGSQRYEYRAIPPPADNGG